ncbi:MAG: hypothetical protein EOO28_35845 [Comamonadaceae bacterium]|nr:MAG: hypothetical protein EOO28_35845 [Comamonadaceae bacterium]
MGIQDRDYYKKWWNDRTRYSEKARFRLPADADNRYFPKAFRAPPETNAAEDDGGAYLRSARPTKKPRPWHPILSFLLFGFICLGIFITLRIIKFLFA